MKIGLVIAIMLTATPVLAFRGTSKEIHWTDELSKQIPAFELHCVLETFATEGFDAELLRMGIKRAIADFW
jgi:hypothetical protein